MRRPARAKTTKYGMNSRLFLTLLCCGSLAFACGPRARTTESSTNKTTRVKRTPMSAPLVSKVDIDVSDGVRFALLVTNQSAKKVELDFPNAQTHDFAVLDSTGREIWRWSRGRMFTSTLQTATIGVDDTREYADDWDPMGHHGKFTVVATLTSSNLPVEQRADFRLP